jgi:hypothetical protein
MPLITSPIPNLIGGVNQQPPSIRQANEAEKVDNAVPSPIEGLLKRPPTERIATVADSGGTLRNINKTESLFVHLIERDETEKYLLVVQESGTADIYDLAGNRKTLLVDSGVSLGSATSGKRKALTIGDVTFISNATNPIAADAATVTGIPSNYNRAGLVWIKQSNYNREHIIKLTSGGTTKVFTHISRSVQITNEGSSGTPDTYDNVLLTYVSGVKATTYPKAQITVGSGGKVTKIVIVEDAIGWESEQVNTVLSANSGDIGGVNNFQVTIQSSVQGEIGTDRVGRALWENASSGYIGPPGGIKAIGPYTASEYEDSVIYIKGSADFTVVVEDDFGGDGMIYIKDSVQRFEDLPPSAPHGYMVKVVGTPESPYDDYWVKFKADNGTFSRGIWEETVAPGLKYKFDYATMPLLLIRQSDGTFYLKKGDGLNGTGAASGANYSGLKWFDRLVGDDLTNPFPTFVGERLQDMVFYQNRLGIMAGENIIFSEVSEFFNFFRTTTLDLLDSDPIDVASSSPRVGKIVAAVPFNRDLILFTPTNQMVLRGGQILSPKQIAIISVADFDSQAATVRPIPSATSVFFTFANGGFTGVRELVPQPALDGSYLANDITNNVSRYITSNPRHITASTHDNLAAVVAGDEIYCYRYFDQNGSRLQSAWFRFTFQDSNPEAYAFARPMWAGFVESDMYVVMLRTRNSTTGFITIEKIRMGVGINDVATTNQTWVTNLDQRTYLAAGSGTYNSTTGLTTFTLPRPMSYAAGKTKVVAVNGLVLSLAGGTSYNIGTAAQGTVNVIGDYSNTAVWVGTNYIMEYEFSTPYLRSGVASRAGTVNAALLTGRLQLRYLTLQYADTGYFRVTAQVRNEDTYEYPFTGEVLGTSLLDNANISSGAFRCPIYSRNENTVIRIINDSPMPCKILSGDIEASYDDRAQRFG